MLRITDKAYLKQETGFVFSKTEKKGEEIGGIPPAEAGNFLHILHGGSEQALLGNLRKPPHMAITEAM